MVHSRRPGNGQAAPTMDLGGAWKQSAPTLGWGWSRRGRGRPTAFQGLRQPLPAAPALPPSSPGAAPPEPGTPPGSSRPPRGDPVRRSAIPAWFSHKVGQSPAAGAAERMGGAVGKTRRGRGQAEWSPGSVFPGTKLTHVEVRPDFVTEPGRGEGCGGGRGKCGGALQGGF